MPIRVESLDPMLRIGTIDRATGDLPIRSAGYGGYRRVEEFGLVGSSVDLSIIRLYRLRQPAVLTSRYRAIRES